MIDDLIKRSDAIKALCDAVDNKGDYEGEWLYTDEFCKAIDSVPSADNEVIGKLKTAIENEEICKNCPTAERISGENLLGAMALGFSYGMEADRPQDDDWEKYSDKLWKNAYERGKEEEHRWWSEHCAKCTDADRPQGEWIDEGRNLWGCSNCGMEIYSESERDRNEFHKWCSRCGAQMKGADDE